MQQDNPSDAIDGELARLLKEHRAAEEMDVRLHVKTCPHCFALSTLIGNLRRDLHDLVDGRLR
jgi:predicted anti-sigma-YlaC factor YlaD